MPVYKAGGYKRAGVVFQGPTKPRGRPLKVVAVQAAAPKPSLSKTTKKAVNSLIKKSQETKYVAQLDTAPSVEIAGSGLSYDGVANQRGWSSGFINPAGLIPAMAQGVGESQRVGNKVRPKNMILKYFLQALPTTEAVAAAAANNTNPYIGVPFRVRVLVYRHRYAQDDYSQTNLLQINNANSGFGSDFDNLGNAEEQD